jgi:hypothetical protein
VYRTINYLSALHISRHFQPHSLFYVITLLAHVSLTFTESLSAPKQVIPGAANQGRSNLVHFSSVHHSAAGHECSSPRTPRHFVTDSWYIYTRICLVCLSVCLSVYKWNLLNSKSTEQLFITSDAGVNTFQFWLISGPGQGHFAWRATAQVSLRAHRADLPKHSLERKKKSLEQMSARENEYVHTYSFPEKESIIFAA